MKISILTFSKENNYGAHLQCYALSKVLEETGHSVSIIDIQLNKKKVSIIAHIINSLTTRSFRRFRKKYLPKFTKKYKSPASILNNPPKADLYIVGSDQVWNPDITNKLDPKLFFFSFLPKGKKRISYAASFGSKTWGLPNRDEYKNLLDQFDAISVRENSGVDICKEVFNVSAQEVLDPTLLLNSYDEICGRYDESKLTNEIVYFHFAHRPDYEDAIVSFANQNGFIPINLKGSLHGGNGMKNILFATVKEWINRIRYARFIITGSFHCMVFCILFHKQFITLPSHIAERSERLVNLQNKLGLSDRMIPIEGNLSAFLNKIYTIPIDYEQVDERLMKLRSDSLRYLLDSIRV